MEDRSFTDSGVGVPTAARAYRRIKLGIFLVASGQGSAADSDCAVFSRLLVDHCRRASSC